MSDLCIYHMPGSCSRVALVALEEIGLPYQDRAVGLMRGEQRSDAYLAINPKGKVPTLVSNGVTVTELPAILYSLAIDHPQAGLLPAKAGGVDLAGLSDLIWLASALHPMANRIFRPSAVSAADAQNVKAGAIAQLSAHAALVAGRLTNGRWWYGDSWSITDTFSAWIFGVASASGFPLSDFPEVSVHVERVEARGSFQRAIERERAAVARDGLELPPGVSV